MLGNQPHAAQSRQAFPPASSDTPITAEDLQRAGFSDAVIEMVTLLTKSDDGSSYADRMAKLAASGNLGAILVKLSDNEDNASPDQPLHSAHTLPARYAASMLRLRRAAKPPGIVCASGIITNEKAPRGGAGGLKGLA